MGDSDRNSRSSAADYSFDAFRVDAARRQVSRGGQVVQLNPRVFETLLVLLRHAGRVVEKEELMKAVWPDSFVSDDSLTQSIWALRRALGDDWSQPRFVATVPRRGYRFIAPVTVSSPDARADAAAGAAAVPVHKPPAAPGAIDWPASQPATPIDAARGAGGFRSGGGRRAIPAAWAAAGTAAMFLLVAGVVFTWTRPEPSLGAIRTLVPAPERTTIVSGPAVSPQSRAVAFVAQDIESGRTRMWVRTLESGETRAIAGSEGATRPFWSADGEALAFFANGHLKTSTLGADPPRPLAAVGLDAGGGAWNADGVILFAGARSGLQSIAAAGGQVSSVTTLDSARREQAHRWPVFLPDGRSFLFTVVSADAGRAGTYLGSLDGRQPTRLFDTPNTFATYAPSGHILYVHDGALMAQVFDAEAGRVRGAPVVVAPNITSPDVLNGAAISASAGGLLAFGGTSGGRLAWFDRRGTRLATLDAPTPLHNPLLAGDQRQVLADTSGEVNPDLQGVWRLDLERGTRARLIRGGAALWSPDMQQVEYTSGRDFYLTPAAGHGEQHLLLRSPEAKGLNDWSRDGRYIVFISTGPATKKDLWVLPLFGDRTPLPFRRTPSDELQGQISPDGRWLAYTSDQSGTWEVYVQSFPVPGTPHLVSRGGGGDPHWRGDGRELFYVGLDHTVMAVAVAREPDWQAAQPQPLFRAPLAGDLTRFRTRYQVTADGQRFLLDAIDDKSAQELTLIVNWPALRSGRDRVDAWR